MSNSLWSGAQRIRQYAGGHAETWGSVTISIDSDVIDGIVAVAGGTDATPPTASWTSPSNGQILNAGMVLLQANASDDSSSGCDTFTAGDPNLGDNPIGDNQVSSVKVEARSSPPVRPSAPSLTSPDDGAIFDEGQSNGTVDAD